MPYKDIEYGRKHRRDYNRRYRKEHLQEVKEKAKIRYQCNKERVLARHKRNRLDIKVEVLTHYGNGKCACVRCGESRMACLSIDHINGGGSKHLKSIKRGGVTFYSWLKQMGYSIGYQTLCMNCQFIKRVENNEYTGGVA